jgi:WD40 repeat protein
MRPERGGELKVIFHDGPHAKPRLERLEEHGIWSLAVAAPGPTLAWGGGAYHARTWDITRQEPRLMRQQDQCLSVALSPDGRLLAAASGRTVKLWDVGRGLEVGFLNGHRGTVRAVVFSPDGRTLVTGGSDKIIRFWSVGDGVHERRRLEWSIGAVYSVAFSPDGLLAAAGGSEGPIVIWDVDE